jgi:hypothetical protein
MFAMAAPKETGAKKRECRTTRSQFAGFLFGAPEEFDSHSFGRRPDAEVFTISFVTTKTKQNQTTLTVELFSFSFFRAS